MMSNTIIVTTDGACSGNPGVGGFAGIYRLNGKKYVVRGCSAKTTTNNKMELMAVIKTLESINAKGVRKCQITIRTDSQYIVNSSGKKASWFKDRPNEELWIQLITTAVKGGHKIQFIKVKAHSGDELNEECDRYAKEECVRAKHILAGNA